MKHTQTFNSHGISESVYNWVKVIEEVYYKEVMKKFTDNKFDTFTKHSAEYSLVHSVWMDKKYIDKYVHKDDTILKKYDKWNVKFVMYGMHNQKDYPLDMSAVIKIDDKSVNLIVNCNFNEEDWKGILTNEDFLDELEDTLAYEITKLIEKINLLSKKLPTYHKGYQLSAVKNYLKMGVVADDNYEAIYFLTCISLSLKHEINARVNQFFQEVDRYDIENTKGFVDIWKDSIHYKIYEALKNFDAKEVYNEFVKNYGENYLKNEIIKQWSNYTDSNEELKDVRIGPEYLENPLKFLKYWGKNFHKSAEYYRRKCMKAYAARFSMEKIQEMRKKERSTKKEEKTTYHYNGRNDCDYD